MKKIIIDGMSCNHCVKHVKEALEELEGITNLEVKIGEALVEGTVTNETLKEAIEDMGYDVIEIKEV